jgi:hypothetical protein
VLTRVLRPSPLACPPPDPLQWNQNICSIRRETEESLRVAVKPTNQTKSLIAGIRGISGGRRASRRAPPRIERSISRCRTSLNQRRLAFLPLSQTRPAGQKRKITARTIRQPARHRRSIIRQIRKRPENALIVRRKSPDCPICGFRDSVFVWAGWWRGATLPRLLRY